MSSTNDTAPADLKLEDLAPSVSKTLTPLTDTDFSRIVHVKGDEHSGKRKLLLAFDTTADAELAFNHTLNNFSQPGDHIFLCTVLPVTLLDTSFLAYAPEYSIDQDLDMLRGMNANAMKHLKEKAQAFAEKGLDVSCHVIHGDPRYTLLTLAKHHKVDMIILGRRKLGRFQKLISAASVSSYVLTHADVTCVIVKE